MEYGTNNVVKMNKTYVINAIPMYVKNKACFFFCVFTDGSKQKPELGAGV